MDPEREDDVHEPMRGLNWTTILLIAGLILVVLVVAYFATSRNADQDKLTNVHSSKSAAASPEKLCASGATYDLIKRELFRRAAQLRGTDQAAYDRLSAVAVLRVENPVMESADQSTGAVNCSGSLSLDLPPGVAAVGGRRTLSSDVDYTIQKAADGSGNVVLLRNADAIIAPLATLARTGQQPAAAQPEENQAAPEVQDQQPSPAPVEPAPAAPQAEPQTSSVRPSFSCATARTRGEIAVCSDGGLAAIDRNLAAEYGHALAVATPDERDLLRQTARRFYAYRDRCPDRQCIAAAYAGRIREIRDIVQGRWQPPQ
jgi:hypothetical protein